MSQSNPPIRPGEIHSPNAFELYWEKNPPVALGK